MKKLIGSFWDDSMKKASQYLIQEENGNNGIQNFQDEVSFHGSFLSSQSIHEYSGEVKSEDFHIVHIKNWKYYFRFGLVRESF